jgi:hypothetical protein
MGTGFSGAGVAAALVLVGSLLSHQDYLTQQRRWAAMTVTIDASVKDFTTTTRKLFIDGEWVDAASGKTF